MRIASLLLSVTLIGGVGCARYEYDVVSPPQAAGHVGTKSDHTFALDPLEYRLRTLDNRLVLRVYNPTGENVTLLGARSTVVDPDGQSHPLVTQTIAPGGSFIKLILPPPRPRVYRGGPTFGIGVGTRVGSAARRRGYYGYGGAYDAFDDWPYDGGPRYMTVYDETDTYYWDWKGEGQVRLNLVYARDGGGGDDDDEPQRAAPAFTHELGVRRVRGN